jgi:hypothetical protein
MAKTRSSRRQARTSAPLTIVNDPAALAQERELSNEPAIESEPDVADKIIDLSAEAADIESERPSEAELAEALGEPIATLSPTESAQEPATPDVTAVDPTDSGRLLASRFETSAEALAYAGNMKLRNYSISRQDDGQYAIEVRKQASAKTTPTQATPAQAPANRPEPKVRTPRAKASGPRPDTRNAVIWSMLTRPEGTTHKEVVAAMDAFELARGSENKFPTGIGSDWKLFANRFGYDRKKTSDADGATRYFCFPFASEASASDEEVEVVTPSETEGERASESESATS